jgi:endonuclease/exonuclease/phosphatase family metal-dependent hydrolase
MRPPLIASILLVLTLSLITSLRATAQQPKSLRVLTYNIHHAEGLDKKLDLPRIATVIRAAEPDLVAIQEVDVKAKRTGGVDEAAELAKLTNMHAYFAKAMDYQGGAYGQLILSKHELTDTKTHMLPPAEPGVEPRIMAEAHVKIGGTSIAFFGTHLDARDNARRVLQAEEIARITANIKDDVSILAGDLNAHPDHQPIALLTKDWTDPSAGKGLLTIPAEKPKSQIDYVLYRPKDRLHPVDVKVLDEPVASDHRPVLAVFEFPSR